MTAGIRTGCDIGIYVGPGVSHVRINAVHVTAAAYQGILVEGASRIIAYRSRTRIAR